MKDIAFSVMFENEKVADCIIKDNCLTHFRRYTNISFKQPFLQKTVNLQDINYFLKDRCIPADKINMQEILESLGLKDYDVIDILKKTHGLDYDDFIWIKFSDENIKYNDIRIRNG